MFSDGSAWFEALEEIGQRPMMTFAIFDKVNKKEKWFELPHKKYDGIGGLMEFAKSEFDCNELHYPIRQQRKISFFEKIKSIFRYLPESKLFFTSWNEGGEIFEEKYRTFIFCDDKKIEILKEKARNHRCSIQTFIHYCLDKTVNELFQKEDQIRRWMIPVNMRNEESRFVLKNLSSYVSVDIKPSTTAREIQQQLIYKLKNQFQYGAWILMILMQYLGRRFLKNTLMYYEKNNHSWTGIFTYIEYQVDEDKFYKAKNKMIFGVAPVTPAHPIACNVLNDSKNLMITYQFHKRLLNQKKIGLFQDLFLEKLFNLDDHSCN